MEAETSGISPSSGKAKRGVIGWSLDAWVLSKISIPLALMALLAGPSLIPYPTPISSLPWWLGHSVLKGWDHTTPSAVTICDPHPILPGVPPTPINPG